MDPILSRSYSCVPHFSTHPRLSFFFLSWVRFWFVRLGCWVDSACLYDVLWRPEAVLARAHSCLGSLQFISAVLNMRFNNPPFPPPPGNQLKNFWKAHVPANELSWANTNLTIMCVLFIALYLTKGSKLASGWKTGPRPRRCWEPQFYVDCLFGCDMHSTSVWWIGFFFHFVLYYYRFEHVWLIIPWFLQLNYWLYIDFTMMILFWSWLAFSLCYVLLHFALTFSLLFVSYCLLHSALF